MTNKEQIQKEIEQTLQSLDGVQRAEANPFLFTRIKARMNKQNSGWERVYSFVVRPVVAIAVLVLLMAVNGWALIGSDNNSEVITESPNASELATEYNRVASVNNYDYENITNE